LSGRGQRFEIRAVSGECVMSDQYYKIRKPLLVILGLDVFLILFLLIMALLQKGDLTERLVFTLFFVPAFFLFLESLMRRVTVTQKGIVIRKLGRSKAFSWEEITRVGCLTLNRKVYLLLTTVKGLFIISNAFSGFSGLVEEIISRVDRERVEEDARQQAQRSSAGIASMVPAWIAAVFMIVMIIVKLFPFTL
jgi:hypothetical protein